MRLIHEVVIRIETMTMVASSSGKKIESSLFLRRERRATGIKIRQNVSLVSSAILFSLFVISDASWPSSSRRSAIT